MAVLWRIELLGGLRVYGSEPSPLRFRSHFIAALLAYLAYDLDTSHPRDLLTELLWPECDRDAGRLRFRVALYSLRRQLEPVGVPAGSVLLADRSSVRLNPARVSTDVGDFRAALRQAAAATEPDIRLAGLRKAVDVHSAVLLPQSDEEWVLAEQHTLERQFTQAVEALALLLERGGHLGEARCYVSKAVALYPCHEELRQTLMRLHAAAGHPEAAQREFQELEGQLQRQLDASPSPATRALLRQITEAAARTPAAPDMSPEPLRPLPHAAVLPSPILSPPEGGALTFLAVAGVAGSGGRLLQVAREHSGWEVRQDTGGVFIAAFRRAASAVGCAAALQQASTSALPSSGCGSGPSGMGQEEDFSSWRIALDSGDAARAGGEYRGAVLDRLEQILSAAHMRQCLCTDRTALLAQEGLPAETRLADLGLYRLRGVPGPQRLFHLVVGNTEAALPLPLAEKAERGRLPEPLTRFFGRSAELGSLIPLLAAPSPRLVTLIGPGGTGKTRLAMEAALRLEREFDGAIWFVPLADLRDPRLLLEGVRDALGLPRLPAVPAFAQIVETLASHRALLVLDNFEQLLAPDELTEARGVPGDDLARQALRDLLQRLPTLTCLVTSRRWLEIGGEQVIPLAPLEIPAENLWTEDLATAASPAPVSPGPSVAAGLARLLEFPSVQLFAERARAVRPDFQVNAHNAEAVGELCRRLEGLPLALELAASRVAIATPARMLERLGARLDFLASRRVEAGGRHRSLRAVCDWSYQLLAPDLKQLFARLSVFRGGWTLAGAEAVWEGSSSLEVSQALHTLVGGSLILSSEERNGEIRFRMLETLREYAQEQLAPEELAALQHRHTQYYLQLAFHAESAWRNLETERWTDCLETERDNFRAALEWCLAAAGAGEEFRSVPCPSSPAENTTGPLAPLELGLRLAGNLAAFWEHRNHGQEGRHWLAALLSLPGGAPLTRANALRGLGLLCWQQGQNAACAEAYRESLALYKELQDPIGIASALSGLGTATLLQRDPVRARRYFQEALRLRRATGNRTGEASSLMQLGHVAYRLDDLEEAATLYSGSLKIERELGNQLGEAACLHSLGAISDTRRDFAEAASLFRSSLEIYRLRGCRSQMAGVLTNLAGVVCREDLAAARSLADECVLLCREQGNQRVLGNALIQAGELAAATGDLPGAMQHLEEAAALARQWCLPEVADKAARALARIADEPH